MLERNLPVSDYTCIFPAEIPEIEQQFCIWHFPVEYDSELCAEIIFTSGSTGKPKGVMISHKNLIANTSSIVEYLQLTPDDRMLVVLPFYYCYGLSLVHTHLQSRRIHCIQQLLYFPRRSAEEPAGLQMHRICRSSESFPDPFEEIRFIQANKIPDLRYVTQAGGKLAPFSLMSSVKHTLK